MSPAVGLAGGRLLARVNSANGRHFDDCRIAMAERQGTGRTTDPQPLFVSMKDAGVSSTFRVHLPPQCLWWSGGVCEARCRPLAMEGRGRAWMGEDLRVV